MKSLPFLPQATAALMIGLTCLSNPVFAKESPANKPAASNGKLSPNLSSDATKETNRIDGIAAIVSDEIITTSELASKTRLIEQQMTAQKVQMPDPNTLRQQVLNRMVLDRAQIRRAKDLGIVIEESQVDSAMETVAQRNNISLKDFLASLTRQGFSSKEFREEIRNELLITKLRQQEVDSKIKVTESEVDSFLNTQVAPNANKTPEVNWIQFLVKVPENTDGSITRKKEEQAKQIEKALKSGQTVEAILEKNPELAIDGTGQMGWQSIETLPGLFTAFLTEQPDDATTILKSPNGFHVLKVIGHRKSGVSLDPTPIPQTHASHILIRVSPDVSENEAKRRLNSALEQLKRGQANFATLAKRYSQDSSASSGGDLGWIYPGDTVPEFEQEMDKLKPGETSPVFQSRFGFHIIQVQERRQQPASEERQRQMVRAILRNEKSEEAWQDWLRRLRDETFIDIRIK